MSAETPRPVPRSRREKVYEGFAYLGGYVGLMVANFLFQDLGFWPSLLAGIGITVPTTLFFRWLALPERKARLALDAGRGLIEVCDQAPQRDSRFTSG